MRTLQVFACAFGLTAAAAMSQAAAPPSIEDFAARARIEDAAISPDGHYVAAIETQNGRAAAFVIDRSPGVHADPHVVLIEPPDNLLTWCRWASNTRLLCGFRGMVKGTSVYVATRLAAVDADGKNMRVLVQGSQVAQGQVQDRIIDWRPGKPDTVLVELDEGLEAKDVITGARVYGNVGTHNLPAVFELNVLTGALNLRQHAKDPVRHWITDRHGQVRLGYGFSGATISYYARLDGDREWRRLTKFEVFTRATQFRPIAISAENPNKAYAYASYQGRQALWLIDLTDKEDPTLVFSHPIVDAGNSVIGDDGRLLGIHYDPGYPMTFFTDERMRNLNQSLEPLMHGKFSMVHSAAQDEQAFIIRSYSDRDAPSFLVLDTKINQAIVLSEAYPGRDLAAIAPMRAISYPARDGTPIPAYLSQPLEGPASNLPLVVMPHGGPIARDRWDYFFLRAFLVSRGYAVLQANFRGSAGYGEDWFYAAHQDWGGLTYDDVVDGARWAIDQKIADPRRICIVGWSFGGYLALLGAQRNADLFRCAVNIAGVSDLSLLIDQAQFWTAYRKRQIGTDAAKLKMNSPRLHAAEFNVPLLMLHGRMDAQAQFEHSELMDLALTRAGKPHRFVVLPTADHQFSAEKDRILLLREVENFLATHLRAVPALPPP